MSSPTASSATTPFRLTEAELKRITLAQLRAWEAETAQGVVVPRADEEDWEDTEIDVRRTAL